MRRFYFDINDGEFASGDEEGQLCESAEIARREAIRTLAEIVIEMLPNGDNRDFTVRVWNDSGEPIFEALLAFKSGWVGAGG